jgi:hypothetical protein
VNEHQWQTSTDPEAMIRFLYNKRSFVRTKAGRRKLRLYACACCRGAWDLILDDECRRAIEVSEAFADGRATKEELEQAREAAREAAMRRWRTGYETCRLDAKHETTILWRAARAAELAADKQPGMAAMVSGPIIAMDVSPRGRDQENRYQVALIRELVGDPFRPLGINRAWLKGTIRHLAQSIDEEQAFSELPVLADALEDAGCTDEAMLSHLRSPGPHQRGCWVIDLLLGKG